MTIVIDAGNTQIKVAVFEVDTLIMRFTISYNLWQENLLNIIQKYSKITNLVVSSVGKLIDQDFDCFNKDVKVHFLNRTIKFPFINLYETPTTLGLDRMILSAGAVLQFPDKNRLIIDAGTCITYDYVDINNNYLGGAIAPGIRLRYEALHKFTAKLPLLTKESPLSSIGKSTNQSIHSGVIFGVVNEIDGFIDTFISQNENFIIILTGGDSEFLAMRLKNTIFANPNFLLESLYQTFQFNQND